jgi:hypothetical protein
MYYQVTLNLIIAVYLICQVKSGSGVRIYSMATNTLLRRYKMPRSTAIPPPCAWKLLYVHSFNDPYCVSVGLTP